MPIRLDLNNAEFQKRWFALEKAEQLAVLLTCRKIASIEWDALYRDKGLRWELIHSRRGSDGSKLYSLRITKQVRAVGCRDGDYLEFLTLHPDHDSAH